MKQTRGNRNRGEKSPRAKFTDAQAADILHRALAGEQNRALATEFGVDESTVGKLARGNSWVGLSPTRRTDKMHTGSRHHLAKLDANKVRKIRTGYAAGKTYRELAEMHGVTISPIRNIVHGITWKHVA